MGTGLTVTNAVPVMLPLVAVKEAVPACNDVNVTEAFPSMPVIAYDGLTAPTVVLLLVKDMLTFANGVEPFRAVAFNV